MLIRYHIFSLKLYSSFKVRSTGEFKHFTIMKISCLWSFIVYSLGLRIWNRLFWSDPDPYCEKALFCILNFIIRIQIKQPNSNCEFDLVGFRLYFFSLGRIRIRVILIWIRSPGLCLSHKLLGGPLFRPNIIIIKLKFDWARAKGSNVALLLLVNH